MIANNNDSGSLKVGLQGKDVKVGDKVVLQGKEYTVTFIMGKGEKTHLCFKGQGPLPTGPVEWDLPSLPLSQVG